MAEAGRVHVRSRRAGRSVAVAIAAAAATLVTLASVPAKGAAPPVEVLRARTHSAIAALATPTVAAPVDAARLASGHGRTRSPAAGPRPRSLDEVVVELLAAVAAAETMAADAMGGSIPRSPSVSDAIELVAARVEAATAARGVASRAATGSAGVDLEGMSAALARVAEAVDRSLPALRLAAPASVPVGRTSTAVVGCDVVDRLPLLCIGSEASNTYSAEAALLVDLGGDDHHLHSAGGAAPLLRGLPVVVTVDVGGNDRYPGPVSGEGLTHGTGFAGGVGLLVDVAGDDAYLGRDAGQGLAFLGAGALVDLAGNDEYRLDAAPTITGWGTGLRGVGVLADFAGDDRYQGRVVSSHAEWGPAAAAAVVGGVALEGVGLSWDAGGHDDLAVSAQTHEPASGENLSSTVVGLGASLFPSSVGLSLWGTGSTSRRVDVVDASSRRHGAVAVGGAALFGSAALRDQGGDDSNIVQLRAAPASEIVLLALGFGAAFTGAGAVDDLGGDDSYIVDIDLPLDEVVAVPLVAVHAHTHGAAGFPGAAGVVRDTGGSDLYLTSVHLRGHGGHELPGSVTVLSQGAAVGGASGGSEDLGGQDRYVVNVLADPVLQTNRTVAQGGAVPVWAMPTPAMVAGAGRLVDSDQGEPDEFALHPGQALCVGARGERVWSDCNGGTGSASP